MEHDYSVHMQLKITSVASGYKTLAEQLTNFSELGHMPIDVDTSNFIMGWYRIEAMKPGACLVSRNHFCADVSMHVCVSVCVHPPGYEKPFT